jgi:SAM-dependent methyltransferase
MSDTPNPAAKAAATYNAAADHFDDEPLAFWSRHGGRTVERLSVPAGAMILDVGCGTGASAIPAAARVGPTGKVVGIDVAERLLEIARGKAAAKALNNVEFRVGDMRQTGYPDAHFDAVICVFAIFFAPDMEAQVRELWRMVRAGGQLAITTWGPRMFEPGSTGWRASVTALRPDLYSAFNPWDRITEPDMLRKLFSDSGISDVEIVAEQDRQALRDQDDWWRLVLGSGYRWTIEQMGPDVAEQARRMNCDWIRDHKIAAVETNALFAIATKSAPE